VRRAVRIAARRSDGERAARSREPQRRYDRNRRAWPRGLSGRAQRCRRLAHVMISLLRDPSCWLAWDVLQDSLPRPGSAGTVLPTASKTSIQP
jgi:hypothetical protein